MTIDTRAVAQVTLPLAIIGWVLQVKGYIPWFVELPLSWGSFALYLIPRTTFVFERNK
jgi:hypothetical protein